jgi:ParB family chromosome partitioning protein
VPNAKGKPARRDAFADLGGAGGAAQYFAPQNPVGVEDLAEAKLIKVNLLESNPYQPRTTFPEAALAELATDIREHGVLQPLLVRPHPTEKGHYQIVAGERRWRAAKDAGLLEVPCIERAMDDATMERLALVENVQRADLDPLDEARAYKRLVDGGLSERDIAASIHKVHSYVQQRLLLIKYPAVAEEVQSGTIGPTVATGIARLADETQRATLLGRARRGDRVTVQDIKDAPATTGAVPSPTVVAPVANISHPAREKRPREAPDAPLDGVRTALGSLQVSDVATLLRYGIARQWTCQRLLDALNDEEPLRLPPNREGDTHV